MEIDLNFLQIQNSWWLGHDISFDHAIEKYEKQELKVTPDYFNNMDLDNDKIYAIYGERGIGKTTAQKLLISQLIKKKKVDSKNIFYYSSHNIDSYEQLNELIKVFVSWRRKEAKEGSRLYIFIDEVTLVHNFDVGLNFLKKAGVLDNATMVLSGSAYLKNTKTKIADEEIIMKKLTFKKIVELLDPNLFKKIKKEPDNLLQYSAKLEYYLDVYLLTGGFISAVNSFKKNGRIEQDVYSKYLAWFNGDITKLGRDLILSRQIINEILLNLKQSIGYKTIAQKTKARMHLTVAEYISIFESLFAIKTVCQVDKNNKPSKSKSKKIFFRDPFLYWTFYSYIYGSLNNWQFSCERLHQESIFNSLIENVIFSHLINDETVETWGSKVMYWRDVNKQKEINFVYNHDDRIIPVLNRYNQKITNKDKKLFEKAKFTKGIIISNDEFDLSNDIKIVPFSYFLLNKPFEIA